MVVTCAAMPATWQNKASADPSQVTSAMIGSYAARLREGVAAPDGAGWIEQPLANASAARALIAVRSLHRFATAEGVTAEDPARTIRPPKPPRRLPKALSLAQVQAMLAVPATDTEVGLRDAALLGVALRHRRTDLRGGRARCG